MLRLGRHFLAYAAMMHKPDQSRRRASLRQLLNSLVESRRLELLTWLDLDELLEEAEAMLLAKARSQDLLGSDFYTILHSLYVSESNYRKGEP